MLTVDGPPVFEKHIQICLRYRICLFIIDWNLKSTFPKTSEKNLALLQL